MALTTLSFFLSDPVADALGSGLEFLRNLLRTPPGSGQLQDLLAVFCRIGGMSFGHFLYSFSQAYHYPPKRVNSTTAFSSPARQTQHRHPATHAQHRLHDPAQTSQFGFWKIRLYTW